MSGALTYQVYAPDALPSQRGMMPSLASASFPTPVQKPSMALRVCLVLVGVCVVVGTAALVIAGASDDAPHASKAVASAASSAAVAPTSSPSASVASAEPAPPEPAATVIAAVAPPEPPVAPVKKGTKPKAAAGGSATGLRGVALPPNPFGGGAATAKPAPKKK